MNYVNRLVENKNHLIDKLSITDSQKEELKNFFAKHPSYESKIDWNKKNLVYDDFKPLLALDGKSKTQAKKKGVEGLVEGVDYKYFGEGFIDGIGKYRSYQPLTWLGSKTLASNKVPPIKGNGAKWCISMSQSDQYWKKYTRDGILFLFVFTNNQDDEDTKYAITLYPDGQIETYTFEDRNIGNPGWCYELLGMDEIRADFLAAKERALAAEIEEAILYRRLEKNEDGTYNKISHWEFPLDHFILDGKLTLKFKEWTGNLHLSGFKLTTLEGCPEIVREGNFTCASNLLTSLEGGPKIVEGSYSCANNSLTSLKGAPEYIDGSFKCQNNKLTSLEYFPSKGIVEDVDCSDNQLVSLKGCPEQLHNFYCQYNNLTSLKDGPLEVGGNYICWGNLLTTLEGVAEEVDGNLDCSQNRLISLKGAPEEVFSFECSVNNLTSLEGAPRRVEYTFKCDHNNLTTLEGAPDFVGYIFDCDNNPLVSLESLPKGIRDFRNRSNALSREFKLRKEEELRKEKITIHEHK